MAHSKYTQLHKRRDPELRPGLVSTLLQCMYDRGLELYAECVLDGGIGSFMIAAHLRFDGK